MKNRYTQSIKINRDRTSTISKFYSKNMLIIACLFVLLFENPSKVHSQSFTIPCFTVYANCPNGSIVPIIDCDNSGDEPLFHPLLIANPSGDCGNFQHNLISGPANGSTVALGQYQITYEATAVDINSNVVASATCSFSMEVIQDNDPPVFNSCPSNITVFGTDNGTGNCTSPAFWASPLAADNCGQTTLSASNIPCGSSFQNGTTTVSYTATDVTGNSSTCSFTVTVICVSGSSEAEKFLFRANILPNPNTGNFTVELPYPATQDMVLKIHDLAGRLLFEKQIDPGSQMQTVKPYQLPEGLYFLQVVSEGKVLVVKKFVKQ
jgi:hypothetical protein